MQSNWGLFEAGRLELSGEKRPATTCVAHGGWAGRFLPRFAGTDERIPAAAFIFAQAGYDVGVLEGGLLAAVDRGGVGPGKPGA